jgi:2-iminobutanoate/2-iminopropanoate deaminase
MLARSWKDSLIVGTRFPVTVADMKKPIFTSEAPSAIGPYSQGIRSGRFLFCSGQIPLDPKSGEIVSGDIATQTRRVMENVAALLRTEGLTFDHIVKTTIFLTDLGDFQKVNEIYGSYFKQDPPARSTVQVSALPKGTNVEIEVIAAAAEADQTVYDTSG